jgi:hypothetical protein
MYTQFIYSYIDSNLKVVLLCYNFMYTQFIYSYIYIDSNLKVVRAGANEQVVLSRRVIFSPFVFVQFAIRQFVRS